MNNILASIRAQFAVIIVLDLLIMLAITNIFVGLVPAKVVIGSMVLIHFACSLIMSTLDGGSPEVKAWKIILQSCWGAFMMGVMMFGLYWMFGAL